MPESVAILKKENQALKSQIDALSKTVNQLQAKVDQDASSDANASSTPDEGVKSLKFLSDGFDEFNSFQKEAKMELKQISVELAKLRTKVDAIGKAIDDICEYSYKFNVKVVGLPEVDVRESAQQTSSLCVSLFRALGADVSIGDLDTAHRVPMRQASGGPRPVICKFVRRLARDQVMARRREARNINPASLNFDENADLSKLGIFDHLTPKTKEIFYEAKKFKTRNQYQYCWTKNSSVYLRKNAESRAIKVTDINALVQLSDQESQ